MVRVVSGRGHHLRGLHGGSSQHADNECPDRELLLCRVSVQEASGTQGGHRDGKLHYLKIWPLNILIAKRGSGLIKDYKWARICF